MPPHICYFPVLDFRPANHLPPSTLRLLFCQVVKSPSGQMAIWRWLLLDPPYFVLICNLFSSWPASVYPTETTSGKGSGPGGP